MVATSETAPHANPHDALDAAAVRAQFPIFDRPLPNGQPLVYLDSAASRKSPAR